MIAAIRRSLQALMEIVRRALPWDDDRIGGRVDVSVDEDHTVVRLRVVK